eukprot:scaffold157270_cov41-Prasinocladus_malaysianus.AAC.1
MSSKPWKWIRRTDNSTDSSTMLGLKSGAALANRKATPPNRAMTAGSNENHAWVGSRVMRKVGAKIPRCCENRLSMNATSKLTEPFKARHLFRSRRGISTSVRTESDAAASPTGELKI